MKLSRLLTLLRRLAEGRLPREHEDLARRGELLVDACEEAVDLRSINFVRREFLHAAPTSNARLLCQTLSRKASLRPRRNFSSFLVTAE
jgi:hypothetical protein